MKNLVMLLLFVILTANHIFAQEGPDPKPDDDEIERNTNNMMSVFAEIGAIEYMSIGFGVNISEHIRISIKKSGFIIGGSSEFLTDGYGLKLSLLYDKGIFSKNFLSMDCVSLEAAFGRITSRKTTPVLLSLNIGSARVKSKGCNFVWSLGVGASYKGYDKILLAPVCKLGVLINI